jgi:hypothetical protein
MNSVSDSGAPSVPCAPVVNGIAEQQVSLEVEPTAVPPAKQASDIGVRHLVPQLEFGSEGTRTPVSPLPAALQRSKMVILVSGTSIPNH